MSSNLIVSVHANEFCPFQRNVMSSTPAKKVFLTVTRHFTQQGQDPFDTVKWVERDVVIQNSAGDNIFEERGIRAPEGWSDNALRVVVTRYFRGQPGYPEREKGVDDLIKRVCGTFRKHAVHTKRMTEEDAEVWYDELCYICIHQLAAWNSPVWFNFGVKGEPQQAHACYLGHIDDTLIYEPGSKWNVGDQPKPWHASIVQTVVREAHIFSLGSGVGTAMENLRSSFESISAGGTASGPISFMLAYDAFAGGIKSGGKTRRAAVMRTMADWHLDLWHGDWKGEDFITCKWFYEQMAKQLITLGWSDHMDGAVYKSLPLQNCNVSVRLSDAFMKAVGDDEEWTLHGTKDLAENRSFSAREIMEGICKATWECGDPGVQFDDTIQKWNTCPADGRITTSNPCSEFLFLDFTACNLASLNVYAFLSDTQKEGRFDIAGYVHTVNMMTISMDLLLDFCAFPDQTIRDKSLDYRTIGIGYGNLAAAIMALGLAYDSDEGRAFAAGITALTHFSAWKTSCTLAETLGVFPRYEQNEIHVKRVFSQHLSALDDFMLSTLCNGDRLDAIEEKHGPEHSMFQTLQSIFKACRRTADWCEGRPVRNAQVSLLAPTGTISYLMDFGSTGFEPFISLKEYKTLSGGGILERIAPQVEEALESLGYIEDDIKAIVSYINENGYVTGCKHLALKVDESVFDCALVNPNDSEHRSVGPLGHLKMMETVQPFLSGGMSKTINCLESTTPKDIEEMYEWAWQHGIKCVSIFRNNSKGSAATGTAKRRDIGLRDIPDISEMTKPRRTRLPIKVASKRVKFVVGQTEGYIHVGIAEGETIPKEIFCRASQLGDVVNGFVEALMIMTSIAVQYGVPWEIILKKFEGMQFPPRGFTNMPEICTIATSIPHFIARWMRQEFNIETAETKTVEKRVAQELHDKGIQVQAHTKTGRISLRTCPTCGDAMVFTGGTCHFCETCYTSIGGCAS